MLVLSQFTGAARELTEALIVNPYDLDEASDALAAALRDARRTSSASACARCARFVAEFNVYRWAGRMLRDAARLRRRERMAGRFEAARTPSRKWRCRNRGALTRAPRHDDEDYGCAICSGRLARAS